jgi:tRNA pseudouridine55 synthase
VAGRRAYDAARAGVALELAPARVEVFAWRDVSRRGDVLHATVECAGGTYVRALARDLGRLTGSAAHLGALRRTRSGPFRVTDAVSIDDVRQGRTAVRPALDALPTIPHVTLDEADAERVLHGMAVPRSLDALHAALVDVRSGSLLAFAEAAGDQWQPRVVMRKAG